ncbi:hypothetical protein ACWE42_25005 [Sutcliffiella cohnii]
MDWKAMRKYDDRSIDENEEVRCSNCGLRISILKINFIEAFSDFCNEDTIELCDHCKVNSSSQSLY